MLSRAQGIFARRAGGPAAALPRAGFGSAMIVIAIGATAGLIPETLSLNGTLAVTAMLVLAIALSFVFILLHTSASRSYPQPLAVGPPGETVADGSDSSQSSLGAFRPDRLLFLIGAATVVEITFRAGRLTLSDTCFVAAFIWCCAATFMGRRVERLPTPLVVGAFLFAVGGIASAIGSPHAGRSMYEVARGTWVLLLWPWTAVTLLQTRRDLQLAMLVWIVSGVIDGVGALGQTTGLTWIAGHIGLNRATGFGDSPNDLGAASATLLVPLIVFAMKFPARSAPLRALQWGIVVLDGFSLVSSGSVSAMAGGVVALLLWTVSPGTRTSARIWIVIGLVAVLIVPSAMGGSVPSPLHRVQQVFSDQSASYDSGSAFAHLSTIAQVWPRISSNPIVGTGIDTQSTLVHNGFIAAWYGGGIFVLIGVILAFGVALTTGWRAAVTAVDPGDRACIWALVCGVVAFMVFFANQPLFFNQYGFIAVALLFAWCRHVPQQTDIQRYPHRPHPHPLTPEAALDTAVSR